MIQSLGWDVLRWRSPALGAYGRPDHQLRGRAQTRSALTRAPGEAAAPNP